MTKPGDIEDVVSSIRRLVAGGAETANRTAGAGPRPAPILLLGAANRVADVEDPFQMIHRRAQEGGRRGTVPEPPHQSADGGAVRDRDEPDDADDASEMLADLAGAVGGDDALRDLIAEVVREELSGALGERITRNVRKLVRREMRTMPSRPDDG